jgi:hypothetical protein
VMVAHLAGGHPAMAGPLQDLVFGSGCAGFGIEIQNSRLAP